MDTLSQQISLLVIKKIALPILLKSPPEDCWPVSLLAWKQKTSGVVEQHYFCGHIIVLNRIQHRKANTEARNVVQFLERDGLLICGYLWPLCLLV